VSAPRPIHGPEQLLERLGGLPGGPELLGQARRREDVALVGGAVRDLLLGHWPRELDVTVARDAAGLAATLAAAISPSERAYGRVVEPVLHERFRTASVAWAYGRIDVAERRAESYPSPGALPEVRPGTFEQDLRRRDFTVNAIALPLHGPGAEGLLAVDGGLQDLQAGLLRVLHERSFRDDPTRILRLARYAARLGFEIEPETRRLAIEAVASGALDTVSGERLGSELWLAAGEADGRAAMRALGELGVPAALGLEQFDDRLAAEAESFLPGDGRRDVLWMAVALRPPAEQADASRSRSAELTTRLALGQEVKNRVLLSSHGVEEAAEQLARAADAPQAWELLDGQPVERSAVIGALAARRSAEAAARVREWLDVQRHVKLEINGNDLLDTGVPEGSEVGFRLRAALMRKREGRAEGREEELGAALEAEFDPGATIEAPGP
jgi:tRNA nucleotidyltransferase (CCA-adding enzyme)